MPEITPEEMSQMQSQAKPHDIGSVTKLAQDVAKGLQELQGLLNEGKGTTDQDRQQMDQIMDLFVDLVEKKLAGSEPGEDPAEENAELNQVPMDAGMNGKPIGPQMKN